MIELGQLKVTDSPSFNESRRKVFELAKSLGFSPMDGSKLATFFSELTRPPHGESIGVRLAIADIGSFMSLEMRLDFSFPIKSDSALSLFFNEVSEEGSGQGTRFCLRKRFPLGAQAPSPEELEDIREMLALPSREELLRDLKNKNDALEEEIQERREAEAALKRSEARTQATLESAPDSLLMVNQQGEIIYANSRVEATFGYSREELLGQSIGILMPDSIRASHHAKVEQFFHEGRSRDFAEMNDLYAISKDGGRVDVDIKLSPLRTEDGLTAIAAIRDVTAQRKAQELIRMLSTVVEQSPVSVTITDQNGLIEYVNPVFCEITGYSQQEVMGRNSRFLKSGKTPQSTYESLWGTILSGRTWRGELINRKKTGELFWESCSVAPITDKDNSVTNFVAVKEDVTEQRIAQQERDEALEVISGSIKYASRIQRSVLPPAQRIRDLTSEDFVIWEPRDVVGGDMYWCELWGEGSLIVLGDCTGHGVPGAFMTLLATGAFKRALSQISVGDPAGIIKAMHQSLQRQLGQNKGGQSDTASDDGLELGLCYLAPDNNTITYAGARMQLFVDRGGSIEIIKGDKKGIAYRGIPYDFDYTNTVIKVEDGTSFIMASDGIIDQVGGPKRRGLGKKRFLEKVSSISALPLDKQGDELFQFLLAYQGDEKRRDDVSAIGFRI